MIYINIFFSEVYKIFFLILPVLVSVALIVWLDRRVWAFVQKRKGPNVVGPFGLLQTAADALKYLFKEIIKEKFLKNTPALKRLRQDVLNAVELRGFLKGIDGRRLEIRSPHSALNTLIQSAGALIVKQATIFLNEIIKRESLDVNMVAHIHDEMQLQTKEDITDYVGQKAVQSIQNTKEFFNFRCELDGEYKIGNNWADTH